MSFVYAINDMDFSIMSDTKISLNDDLKNLWNTEDERRIIEYFGLIKSIIVSPNIVVCYAGNNIDKAAELLRKIKSAEISLEQIIDFALEIHKKVKVNDIEFIIGYCDENGRELISIKNREVIRNCKVAWIGSLYAYKEFKRRENDNAEKIKNRHKGIIIERGDNQFKEILDEELVGIYQIEQIFQEVVESGMDSTVGGMTVRIKIPMGKDTFEYMAGMSYISSSWPQEVKSGEKLEFRVSAEEGSYCCNIYQSALNFCCYIYEDNLGIVYTDEQIYEKGLKGMKFPRLYKVDKEKFDLIAENNGAFLCIDLL